MKRVIHLGMLFDEFKSLESSKSHQVIWMLEEQAEILGR